MSAKIDTSKVILNTNFRSDSKKINKSSIENETNREVFSSEADNYTKIFQLAKSYAVVQLIERYQPSSNSDRMYVKEISEQATEFLHDALQVVYDYMDPEKMSLSKKDELNEDFSVFIKELAKCS
jgi:hypothetical protein